MYIYIILQRGAIYNILDIIITERYNIIYFLLLQRYNIIYLYYYYREIYNIIYCILLLQKDTV